MVALDKKIMIGLVSDDTENKSVRQSQCALIFSAMADLAFNKVTEYRSDFFRDAIFLDEFYDSILEAKGFWYAIREYGTHISFSRTYLNILKSQFNSKAHYYRFDITDDGSFRWLTVSCISNVGELK